MKTYLANIEQATLTNTDFRRVLFTGPHSQLVVMSIMPGEEIGEETHDGVDQFIRFESGEGVVVLDGEEHTVKVDDAVVIPSGTKHNVKNAGSEDLKLYTIYSPAEHLDGTVHHTKAEALADPNEH